MKYLLFILISLCLFFFACRSKKKGSVFSAQFSTNIESFIDLVILDESGNNLLSPDLDYRNKMEVIVYDKKGKPVVYNDPTKTAKKGYIVNESDYSVRLFLSIPTVGDNISYTFFRFNGQEVDVFKTLFSITDNKDKDEVYMGSNIVRNKIWLNDQLIWDINEVPDMGMSYVKLIKTINVR